MVGGKVIGLARRATGETLLHVQDTHHSSDQCSVRVKDEGRIKIGDQVWWQCGEIMWTPQGNKGKRCGVDFDIHLPKIGYSH